MTLARVRPFPPAWGKIPYAGLLSFERKCWDRDQQSQNEKRQER